MHTQNSSVWVKSRPSPCGLVGLSNTCSVYVVLTGILWSASLRLDWIHNLKILSSVLCFTGSSNHPTTQPLWTFTLFPLWFEFLPKTLLLWQNYNRVFDLCSCWNCPFSFFCTNSQLFIATFYSPTFPPLTATQLSEAFSGLRSRSVSLFGCLRTQTEAGAVTAERDGYNNSCSGNVHVLNYHHKCTSIRLQQVDQRHPLTFPFCSTTIPWPTTFRWWRALIGGWFVLIRCNRIFCSQFSVTLCYSKWYGLPVMTTRGVVMSCW